jgi:hypothetical protein
MRASARNAIFTHRWLRSAIQSRTRRTETVLTYMNDVAGEFIDGEVSTDLTHYAMHALGDHIWGFSPEAFEGGPPRAAPADR